LFNRFIAEIMILGLMGFTVWSCVQGKVFKTISKKHLSYRPDPYALLHLVEDVHMELFIAMCFVFIGMGYTIHRCVKYQMKLRKAWRYRRDHLNEGATGDSALQAPEGLTEFEVKRYLLQRDFFIRTMHVSCPEIDENFDFSRYLACCLDHIVEDLTEFSISTWGFVIVIKLITLGIAASGKDCSDPTYSSSKYWPYEPNPVVDNCPDTSNGVGIDISIELVLQAINIGVYIYARFGERWTLNKASELKNDTEAHLDDTAPEFPKSKLDDRTPMRLLQSVSFTVAYGFAQKIAARRIYVDEFGGRYGDHLSKGAAAAYIIGYFFLWVLQIFVQSETVITFTTVLALPPYVDQANKDLAIAVSKVYDDNAKNDFQNAATVLGLPVDLLKERLMADYEANMDAATKIHVDGDAPSMGNLDVESSEAGAI